MNCPKISDRIYNNVGKRKTAKKKIRGRERKKQSDAAIFVSLCYAVIFAFLAFNYRSILQYSFPAII